MNASLIGANDPPPFETLNEDGEAALLLICDHASCAVPEALVGLGLGAILPPRDLMIRAVIPPGETGKVFGFVFVGYSIGVSIASVLFGWLLDLELPAMVLFSAPCSRFWPRRQSSPRDCWRSDPKIKQPKIRFKFRRIIAGPGSRFTYAAATSLSLMVKPPSVAETLIVSPSVMAPSKIRLARGFCNCRWITRFRGRAP